MNAADDRRIVHEAFVTGHKGSSPLDIVLAVLPAVGSSFVSFAITGGRIGVVNFIIEYILCCLPLIFSFTLFNGYILELTATSFLLALLAMTLTQHSRFPLPVHKSNHLPFLTCSRALVNLATVIAILAVDFHCFPRRFAKTEEYGYSLMDVGAPCYVFMNGITDKNRKANIRSTLKDFIILLLLGVIRFIFIYATNYQQHVTEYGIHGNFFFILAFLKISCLCGFNKLNWGNLSLLSILAIVTHQWFLFKGNASWILSQAQREGFISGNRESIFAMPGYFSLYLLGIALGDFLFATKKTPTKDFPVEVILSSIILGGFIFIGIFKQIFEDIPSRRLMNLPFVAWIVSIYCLFLLWFKVLSNVARVNFVPGIFTAINSHGLLFFLVANVFTGVINIVTDTMSLSFPYDIFIIGAYTFLIVGFVYFIFSLNRK